MTSIFEDMQAMKKLVDELEDDFENVKKYRRPISEYDEYDIERKTTDGKVKNTRTGESHDSTTTSIDDYPPDLESGL